ncbi:MAG: radical SAM protein, partial [Krumholzibacteria bacterium]|nr:radical SAM protein [Candidatus Krumholzibacteria bacterium]
LGRVRITGGEPLLRAGLAGFVARLAALPGAPEITLTTNGVLLARHAAALRDAGVRRVNVSLDTLDRGRFSALTGADALDQVLAGLRAARAAGLAPLKLNSVLRRGSYREDVPALLDFARAEGLELRFIELMRTGTADAWCRRERVSTGEVLAWLARHRDGGLATVPADQGPAPARLAVLPWRGEDLTVGWISPVSDPFCGACNRLRLGAGGRLRRCLMDPRDLDLGAVAAADDTAGLDRYLAAKRAPGAMDQPLPMSRLGG